MSMSFILIDFSHLNSLGNSGLNPGYHYLFSVKSIPKVIKYILNINYIFLLVFFYSLFIYISIKIYKFLKNKNFLIN